jgi:hypothetical protein
MEYATLGIGVTDKQDIDWSKYRKGFTEKELKAFYRQPAPAAVQAREGQAYNRLLAHIWGTPEHGLSGSGYVAPLIVRPTRIILKPPQPVAPHAITPIASTQFALSALHAATSVGFSSRLPTSQVWIADAFDTFHHLHPEITFTEFKRMLLQAQQQGLIDLDTATLKGRIPPELLIKQARSKLPGTSHNVINR